MELRDCRNCGGVAVEMKMYSSEYGEMHCVKCAKCGACTPYRPSPHHVRSEWNIGDLAYGGRKR